MKKKALQNLQTFLKLVTNELKNPSQFDTFHQAVRAPFDYYQFGLDFIAPLLDIENSQVHGIENLNLINDKITKGENVILLANHQTEPDPQIISLLLQKKFPQLAEQMIFVAGHRVTSDPLAKPFSLGRNLLCIYSKKHLTSFTDQKADIIAHNRKTIQKLQELLQVGGKCIYVAPSGGRDRPDHTEKVVVAPFDTDSLKLFYLVAKKAKTDTSFFPLALKTYAIMPPPDTLRQELGEQRKVARAPAQLYFEKPSFTSQDKEIDFSEPEQVVKTRYQTL